MTAPDSLGPYREASAVEREPGTATRYVPLTVREERLRRVLRSVPVLLLAGASFLLERPWLIAAALAWGLGAVLLSRLHARSLNARLKALAGTLARDGDPSVAARGLEAIVADARGYPGFHCVALLFLGIAKARAGNADGALDLLYVVQKSGWLSHRLLWMAWLLPWLSQLHAARGEIDLAEQWLEVARTKLPADKKDVLVSPAVLVALRRGRNDEVVIAVDAYVGTADASDPVRQHFALLRAFALDRAGKPLPEAEVRELVQARRSSPGRALPLEAWWADFATYLDAHA
ncbi:MAG TPA: hypothetical protein VIF09_26715 [Polyangiaceae bacterium]